MKRIILITIPVALAGCFYDPPPLEKIEGTSGGSGDTAPSPDPDPPGHEATSYPAPDESDGSAGAHGTSGGESTSEGGAESDGSSSESGSTSTSVIDPCVLWGAVCRPDDPEEGEATCHYTIQIHLDTGEECAQAYRDWYLCRAVERDCAGQNECAFHLEIVMEICAESTFTSGGSE